MLDISKYNEIYNQKKMRHKRSSDRNVNIIIFVIALVHIAVTFFTDKFIFTFPDRTDVRIYRFFLFDYTVCKIIAFAVLYYFYTGLYRAFLDKNKERNMICHIVRLAAPYLIVMIPVCIIKLPAGFLTNDEYAIFDMASQVSHNTWFTYITVYYYVVSLMLIPYKYSPIIVKLVVEYLVAGYVVYRFKAYFEKRTNNNILGDSIYAWESESIIDKYHIREKVLRGSSLKIKRDAKRYEIKFYWLAYILFLLYPVIAYTTSAHRLPIYFLLYLVMVVTFVFDKMEGAKLSKKKGFFLLLLSAVLTNFRTEGIYLLVFVPIIMCFVYKNLHLFTKNLHDNSDHNVEISSGTEKREGGSRLNKKNAKNVVVMLAVSLALQALVYIPQNVMGVSDINASATDRMKPFYAYTIVNMMRNGLDREKNASELAVVDKYMAIDKIDAINEHYGDINYEDTLILFEGEYYGIREDADVTEYFNYADALTTIFKNNPDIFIKTRIGAFCYAAVPYHISFGASVKGFIKGLFSVFKSVSYNLFIPLAVVLIVCVYALFKKRWMTFFITGGILAHWFIVFILAPASYFKYYFPVYICGYLYLLLIITQLVYNKRALKKITFLN